MSAITTLFVPVLVVERRRGPIKPVANTQKFKITAQLSFPQTNYRLFHLKSVRLLDFAVQAGQF
jgi:hypothetical protein